MSYSLSHCICIETPDSEAGAKLYKYTFGIGFSMRVGDFIELKSAERLLYFDKDPEHKTIFEFNVDDLDSARADLEAKGCTVIRWGGKGKPCYMQDPFGNVFNLYQP